MNELEARMQKALTSLKGQLATLRTGRANPEMLSKVSVSYYGTMVPLQQVASITVPEPMMFVLNVYDKSALKDVEKAIQAADLNLTPLIDGNVIRLRLPELTEERRKELVKVVRRIIEESRVSIRNIRRDYMDDVKAKEKNREISEDETKRMSESVQKLTDKYIGIIDSTGRDKEAEIMKI